VAPVAGTTRDMLRGPAEWQGRHFTLTDTGGLFGATTDPLHSLVIEHGLKALKTADLVVFVVDAKDGLVPGDERIAQEVHKLGKPFVMAVNKTDDKKAQRRTGEFFGLGIEPVLEVSAEHGSGVAELLDVIVSRLPKGGAEVVEEDDEIAVAIVGRPNVGKSSLVNRLLREERVMVNDAPGTTRDAVDVLLRWRKRTLRIVDTAGMRRPGKVADSGLVEMVSVTLAKRAMARADVAVLVVDAVEGVSDREAAIAGEAEEAGCGVIIAVNKWDLVRGRGQDWVEAYDDKIRFQIKFLEFAPIIHLSALTGEHTPKLLELIDKVDEARKKRVPTSQLNQFLERITSAHPPPSPGKRAVRILYGAQTGTAPPKFVLFTNVATELHFSYTRFVINQLREAFGFLGTPVRLSVRKRARK
jgi:GTP-binding protein